MLNIKEFEDSLNEVKLSPVGSKISAYILKCHKAEKDIDCDKIHQWLIIGGFPSSYLFANFVCLGFLMELFPDEYLSLYREGFFSLDDAKIS
jgi:hypothetical protein